MVEKNEYKHKPDHRADFAFGHRQLGKLVGSGLCPRRLALA